MRKSRKIVFAPLMALHKAALYFQRRFGEKQVIIFLAILIGVVISLFSAGLHYLVGRCEIISEQLSGGVPRNLSDYRGALIFLGLPFLGLFVSFMTQKILGGKGYYRSLAPLILSLNLKKNNLKFSDMFSHLISSGLSVGFGGSAGLEAPSVIMGAAVGTSASGCFAIDRRKRNVLVGCGAAAAIAAIFGSPVAGVLFAAEVLLPEFSVSALIPMIISSALSAVMTRFLVGKQDFFYAITNEWRLDAIPYYFACGVFCAIFGGYIIWMTYFLGRKLMQYFPSPWLRLSVGGAVLCGLLFVFPILRGHGYGFVAPLFKNDAQLLVDSSTLFFGGLPEHVILVILVLAVLVFKVIASALTIEAGGDGGMFAPSMFIGAFAGFAFARVINNMGFITLQEYNFVAVGMCGVFTAVMRAPMTGIFLIAELTGGYILLVPLMIVSATSYFVSRLFEPNSIYRKGLVENKLLLLDNDKALLRRIPVKFNLIREFSPCAPSEPISRLIELLENTGEPVFPVLDGEGKLLGIIHPDEIRYLVLNHEDCQFMLVFDIMEPPRGVINIDENMLSAMNQFERYDLDYLPVCNEANVFQGFINRSACFDNYRRLIREENNF